MPRKKKPPLSFVDRMRKIISSGLGGNNAIQSRDYAIGSENDLESLEIRVKRILGLTEKINKKVGRMLFFVMYDIESNKVRRLVCKYLLKQGCYRIQRSIFLAEASVETYNTIKNDLSEVQAAYDNKDSIIVLPVSTDYLRMMKIIGQNIDVDVITHSRNTLFF